MLPTNEKMTPMECKRVLRRLELEAYCGIVNAFRAQGELSPAKKDFLQSIQDVLSISTERHKAEVRRAVTDETLTSICETLNGSSASLEWSIEGRWLVPHMHRSVPQTAYLEIANKAAREAQAQNKAARLAEEERKKKDASKVTLEGPTPIKAVGDHVVLPAGTKLPEKSVMDHPNPDEQFKAKEIEPTTKNLPFVSIALGGRSRSKGAQSRASLPTPKRPPSSKTLTEQPARSEPPKKARKMSTESPQISSGTGQKDSHQPVGSAPYSPGHPHTYSAPPGGGSKYGTPPMSPPSTQSSKPHFLHTALTTGQEPGGVRYFGPPGREKDLFTSTPHPIPWREPPKKHTPGIVRKSSSKKHHKHHHSSKHGHAASIGTAAHQIGAPTQPLTSPTGTPLLGAGEQGKQPPVSTKKEGHKDKSNTKTKSPLSGQSPATLGGGKVPPTSVPGSIYKVTTVGTSSVPGVHSPQYYTTASSPLAMSAKYSPLFTSPRMPNSSAAQIVKMASKDIQQRTAEMQMAGGPGKGNVIVVKKSPGNAKSLPVGRPSPMTTMGTGMTRPKIIMTTTSGSLPSPYPGHTGIRYSSPVSKATSPIVMSPGGRIRQIIRTAIPSTTQSTSSVPLKTSPSSYLPRGYAEMKDFKGNPGQLPMSTSAQILQAGQNIPGTRLGQLGTKWTMVSSSGHTPLGATAKFGPKGPITSGHQPGTPVSQKLSVGNPTHHVVIPVSQKGPVSSGYPISGPQGQKVVTSSGSYQPGKRVYVSKKYHAGSATLGQTGASPVLSVGESLSREGQTLASRRGAAPGGLTISQMAGSSVGSKGPTTTAVHTALTAKLLKGSASLNPAAKQIMGQATNTGLKGPEHRGISYKQTAAISSSGKPVVFTPTSREQGRGQMGSVLSRAGAPSTATGFQTQGQSPLLHSSSLLLVDRQRHGPSEQSAESAARALLDIHSQSSLQAVDLAQPQRPNEKTSTVSLAIAKPQSTTTKPQTLQMLSKSLKKSAKGETPLVTIEDQGVVPKRINLTPSDVSEFVDQFEEFLEREGLSEHLPDTKTAKGGDQLGSVPGKVKMPLGPGAAKASNVTISPGKLNIANVATKPTVRVSEVVAKQIITEKSEMTGVKRIPIKMAVSTPKPTVGQLLQHQAVSGRGGLPKTDPRMILLKNVPHGSTAAPQGSIQKQPMETMEQRGSTPEKPGQPPRVMTAQVKIPKEVISQLMTSVDKPGMNQSKTPHADQTETTTSKSDASAVGPKSDDTKIAERVSISDVAGGVEMSRVHVSQVSSNLPKASESPEPSRVSKTQKLPEPQRTLKPAQSLDLSEGSDRSRVSGPPDVSNQSGNPVPPRVSGLPPSPGPAKDSNPPRVGSDPSEVPHPIQVADPLKIPGTPHISDPMRVPGPSQGPDPAKDSNPSGEGSNGSGVPEQIHSSDKSKVPGPPQQSDPTEVSDPSKIPGPPQVSGTSSVSGLPQVTGTSKVPGPLDKSDQLKVPGPPQQSDPSKVPDPSQIPGPPKVSETAKVPGPPDNSDQSKVPGSHPSKISSPPTKGSDQSKVCGTPQGSDPSSKVPDPYQWEETSGDPNLSALIKAISQPKVSLVKIKQQGTAVSAADAGSKQAQSVARSPQQKSANVVLESGSSFDISHMKLEDFTSQRLEEMEDGGGPHGDISMQGDVEDVGAAGVRLQVVRMPEGGKRMPQAENASEITSDMAVASGSDSSISDMSGSETGHLRASKRKRKAPTPIDEETGPSSMPSWARAAWNMLLRVMRFRGGNRAKGDINAASWFNRPVDPKESPDYFKIIKTPMDFSTVKRNLENGVYHGFPDFHLDMILVRRNCLKFNPPGHKARKDCDEVFQFYQEEYNKAMERWGKGAPKSPKRVRPDPAPK